jgi:lipopolysaccharide biosynthesis glycosyltransferase
MKRLIYQVYTGKQSNLYDHCVDSVAKYAGRIGAEHIVQRDAILRIKPDVSVTNRSAESYEKHGGFLPIYEKENAFSYLTQYDQIAIVDADIYIRESAPDIFSVIDKNVDFAAVVERDMPITPKYKGKIKAYTRGQYKPLEKEINLDWRSDTGCEFMNMGLIVINKSLQSHLHNQTPEQFIRRPEFKRFVDGLNMWKWSTDQTLLNYWIRKEPITYQKLNWQWNGLFGANTRIKECHFVHFFLKDHLPSRGENVQQLMKQI